MIYIITGIVSGIVTSMGMRRRNNINNSAYCISKCQSKNGSIYKFNLFYSYINYINNYIHKTEVNRL